MSEIYIVKDLNLAAALDTLGHKPYAKDPAAIFYKPGEKKPFYHFHFESTPLIDKLAGRWGREETPKDFSIDATQEQLLLCMKMFCSNRGRILDFVNHGNVSVFMPGPEGIQLKIVSRKEILDANPNT